MEKLKHGRFVFTICNHVCRLYNKIRANTSLENSSERTIRLPSPTLITRSVAIKCQPGRFLLPVPLLWGGSQTICELGLQEFLNLQHRCIHHALDFQEYFFQNFCRPPASIERNPEDVNRDNIRQNTDCFFSNENYVSLV